METLWLSRRVVYLKTIHGWIVARRPVYATIRQCHWLEVHHHRNPSWTTCTPWHSWWAVNPWSRLPWSVRLHDRNGGCKTLDSGCHQFADSMRAWCVWCHISTPVIGRTNTTSPACGLSDLATVNATWYHNTAGRAWLPTVAFIQTWLPQSEVDSASMLQRRPEQVARLIYDVKKTWRIDNNFIKMFNIRQFVCSTETASLCSQIP